MCGGAGRTRGQTAPVTACGDCLQCQGLAACRRARQAARIIYSNRSRGERNKPVLSQVEGADLSGTEDQPSPDSPQTTVLDVSDDKPRRIPSKPSTLRPSKSDFLSPHPGRFHPGQQKWCSGLCPPAPCRRWFAPDGDRGGGATVWFPPLGVMNCHLIHLSGVRVSLWSVSEVR